MTGLQSHSPLATVVLQMQLLLCPGNKGRLSRPRLRSRDCPCAASCRPGPTLRPARSGAQARTGPRWTQARRRRARPGYARAPPRRPRPPPARPRAPGTRRWAARALAPPAQQPASPALTPCTPCRAHTAPRHCAICAAPARSTGRQRRLERVGARGRACSWRSSARPRSVCSSSPTSSSKRRRLGMQQRTIRPQTLKNLRGRLPSAPSRLCTQRAPAASLLGLRHNAACAQARMPRPSGSPRCAAHMRKRGMAGIG